jgi:Zn-dependent peptidase ImmA (M78 family)/DNA-binding XRE family transcriptional regulator
MKPGTPQFVGARLREGREARGLSVIALADMLDVQRETIYQLEQGKITPSPLVFSLIQQALRLPADFFFDDSVEESDKGVLFRSLSSTSKTARLRAGRLLDWLRRIERYLSNFVLLPNLDVPDLGFPSVPSAIRDEDIEKAADQLRHAWGLGLGPIGNMTWLLENHGIIVARRDLAADKLDAAHLRSEGAFYVILGADKGTNVRSRMDAAHELGHMVIHYNCPTPSSEKDPAYKLMESQAFLFAGAFLLPSESFSDDVYTASLDEFLAVKPKWHVSVAAMIMRARQLGLITDDSERRLWVQYNRRGWKRGEPYDDEWPPEQPVLLRRSFEMILDASVTSIDDIRNSIKIDSTDIEELASLPRGTISNGPTPIAFHSDVNRSSSAANNIRPFRRTP